MRSFPVCSSFGSNRNDWAGPGRSLQLCRLLITNHVKVALDCSRLAYNSGSTAHAMSPLGSWGHNTRRLTPKLVAEHRKAALGRLARGLVLNHIPVLHENPVLHSNDVRRDPVHGKANPREPSVQDD